MKKTNITTANVKQRNAIESACIENAKWLLRQARENFKRQNFGLATFLAITAYEESLKFRLLKSNGSKMLSDKKYNKFASSHIPKLLSKHAAVVFYVDGKRVKQEFALPNKVGQYDKEVNEIIDKRERSLYVDFRNRKINVPTKMNPAEAMEEIDRAHRSIESETATEQLELLLKKRFEEIRKQEVIKPAEICIDIE